jgi:alkylated DNA repair protein alkB homolog 6
MKLNFNDIKSRLQQKPKIIRPSVANFSYFEASKLDIAPFQLTEELWVIPNYITPELESRVLDQGVNSVQLTPLRNRSAQMFGGTVTPSGLADPVPLPIWLDIFSKRLFDEYVFPFKPNHVLINEYKPGDGIMPHTDGPAYFPLVSTLSLGSPIVLQFWKDGQPSFGVYLPQRSLVIFIGSLYYELHHSIETITADYILKDSCGKFVLTSKGAITPLLGPVPYTEPLPPDLKYECPVCRGEFTEGFINYRSTRVSLTIRYVPLIV